MGMEKFNQTVLDIIGHTPIVKLQKVATHVASEIYVKLEYMNPGGSIKDRIGYYILKKAVESGKLKKGGTIIEGTSGNTGFGLAMFAAIHGYKSIFVLADKQSKEKIDALRAFGSKVIVCPTNVEPDDPQSYYSVSQRLADSTQFLIPFISTSIIIPITWKHTMLQRDRKFLSKRVVILMYLWLVLAPEVQFPVPGNI